MQCAVHNGCYGVFWHYVYIQMRKKTMKMNKTRIPNPVEESFRVEERFRVSDQSKQKETKNKLWIKKTEAVIKPKVAWWIFKTLIPDTVIVCLPCIQNKCIYAEWE